MAKKTLRFIVIVVIALSIGIFSGFLISKRGINKSAAKYQATTDKLRTATRDLQKRLNESEENNRELTTGVEQLERNNRNLRDNIEEYENKLKRTNVLVRNITAGTTQTKDITSGVIRQLDRVIEQVRELEPD